MSVTLRVLGCGGSTGVPLIGGDWGTCDPAEPRNRRTRPSVLLMGGETTLLVDTSPDLKEQLLAAGRGAVDGVLYTHAHADHVHGIDDLRQLFQRRRRPIPVFARPPVLAELTRRFGYLFHGTGSGLYQPCLTAHDVTGDRLTVGGLELTLFEQDHRVCTTLGVRAGPIAYSTDVVALDDAAFAALAGVQDWVVDAVRREPHPTHAHVALALRWAERVGAPRVWLTHMNHTMDYATLCRELPPHVRPAHDGLVIGGGAP